MNPSPQQLPPAARAGAVALILPVVGLAGWAWQGDWRWAVAGLTAGLVALLGIVATGVRR